MDAYLAFDRYEQVRTRLPVAHYPLESRYITNLLDIAADFDTFIFDAFGVLNIGNTVIPDAPQRLRQLTNMGKNTFVLTNGATYPARIAVAKYHDFGYAFSAAQVVSSRDQLLESLTTKPAHLHWGVAAARDSEIESFPVQTSLLTANQETFDRVDGFILLSSNDWDQHRQEQLVASLIQNPRPVLVGNPDLVAPREDRFSLEPGFFAHDLADRTNIMPQFFGKPFDNAFAYIKKRLQQFNPKKVLMVGDSLHTDIIGGAAAGFHTALITDFGLFNGHEVEPFISKSGIVPDFILPGI